MFAPRPPVRETCEFQCPGPVNDREKGFEMGDRRILQFQMFSVVIAPFDVS